MCKLFTAREEGYDWQKSLEEAHKEEVGGGLLTRKESDGALEALRRVRLDVRGEKA